jgi:hypothetical protein
MKNEMMILLFLSVVCIVLPFLLKNKELTIFIFFELYEYVSKQEKHEIFKISDKNNKNELSLFTEYQNEEIGKFPKYEKKVIFSD